MSSLLTLRRTLLTAAVLLAAACGSDSSGPGDDPGAEPGPGGHVPPEVVGDWKWGTISLLSFWDDHTGDYLGTAGGVAVFFTFEEAGHYTMHVYALSRTYGCVKQTWTQIKGAVDFSAGTFAVEPRSGRYKAADNCVAGNNFDRAMTSGELAGARKSYHWNWRTDETSGKTYLMIGESPDLQSSFEPAG